MSDHYHMFSSIVLDMVPDAAVVIMCSVCKLLFTNVKPYTLHWDTFIKNIHCQWLPIIFFIRYRSGLILYIN